jgi:two-component system, OmpR family, KDP operon response regulator KdpE
MSEHRRILLVDDEAQITRVLRTGLAAEGYDVRVANDGQSALDLLQAWTPDIVVTDLAMPEMDGLELCSRIRKSWQMPIIVLSVKGEERKKVRALDAGADDYVTKPFGMKELSARIRANLRRAPSKDDAAEIISVGDFSVDVGAHLASVAGRELRLTPREFDLLIYFARHPHKAINHKTLLTAVWGTESINQSEYLRVFIGQIRKKIEPEPTTPRYILTEPRVGYRFEPGS